MGKELQHSLSFENDKCIKRNVEFHLGLNQKSPAKWKWRCEVRSVWLLLTALEQCAPFWSEQICPLRIVSQPNIINPEDVLNSFGQGFQLAAKNLVEQALWPCKTITESLVSILSRSDWFRFYHKQYLWYIFHVPCIKH